MKKTVYLALGCVSLALGALGSVFPILPTVPFLLLAAFCFAKSSEKMHTWFINTKLYKNNLESYVQGKGMTWAAKLRIMLTVTALMALGFMMMALKNVIIGCTVLGCVWAFHIIYFIWGVKTIPVNKEPLSV